MKISPEITQILDLMAGKNRFLITSHMDPDGDSIGSQMGLFLALKNRGKDIYIANQGGMPEKYAFLDPDKTIQFSNRPLPFEPEVAFVLECPALERIGFVRGLFPQSATVINIDHHLDNQNYGHINLVDIESCAVGEMIYAILKDGGHELTANIAMNLYAAIISDTGNFRFASTSARGMRVAAALIECGANPKEIFDRIFSKSSPETMRLLGYVLATLNTTADGRIGYMTVTRDLVDKASARIEDSEGFIDYSLGIAGVRMGILFKEMNSGEIKVSVRSQNGIDAASFAKKFSGGGHINAAGFTLKGDISGIVGRVLADAQGFIDAA
jgi:phosphoesterase RecJ-like protein